MTVRQIYGAPMLFALSSLVGLVSALVGDDLWDVVSWLGLAAPLVPVARAMRAKATAAALAFLLVAPSAARAEDEPPPTFVLDPTTVESARPENDYVTKDTATTSRVAESILDTPRSVQVVPERLLEDRAVLDPQEAITSVSGVQRGGSRTGLGESYIVRGFPQQALFKDGFRAGTAPGTAEFTFEGPTEVANLERIEVLKGPAAILYGRGEPGGTVNYVTRSPSFDTRFRLQQQVGSDDFYRTEVHGNAALVPDALAARVDAAYQTNGSFIDFVDGERFFVAPALRWKIAPRTTLTVRGEYASDDRSTTLALPFVNGSVPDGTPYDRYFGEPGFTELEAESLRGLVQLEHEWTDEHRTTLSFHGVRSEAEGGNFILFNFQGDLQDQVTGDIARAAEKIDFTTEYLTPRLDHVWTTTIAESDETPIANQLLVSAEFDRQTVDGARTLSGHAPLNPIAPVYTGYSPRPLLPGFPDVFFEERDDELEATSVLLLDRISYGELASLSFGGRLEWFEATSLSVFSPPDLFPDGDASLDERTFDPTVGLVVKPRPALALFASYSESTFSFKNVTLTTADGSRLDPETSRQYEVGAKAESFDGRVLVTASLFQIDKQDVAGTDPTNPLFSVNAGEERSRGFELDVGGEPILGWRLSANYAYLDARITDDPSGLNEDNRRFGVPEHSGGIFTTYELREGALEGLAFGGGVVVSDRTEVDRANSATLPGWYQADAVVAYRRGPFAVQLNVKNLTDEEFFFGTDTNEVQRAAARTVLGSVSVEF